jgi:hypothetical protein
VIELVVEMSAAAYGDAAANEHAADEGIGGGEAGGFSGQGEGLAHPADVGGAGWVGWHF